MTAPKHAPHARRTPFVILVLGLIASALLTLLALNTASAANEVRRHDIADQDQSIAARVEQLQVDAQNSAAPQNVARAAGQLGMVPAGEAGFIVIGKDGKPHLLKGAADATASPVYIPPASPTTTASKSVSRTASKSPSSTATSTATLTATSTATSTSTATATSTATTTASTKSAGRHKHAKAARHAATPTSTPTSTPAPTPAPTPTITLGGEGR